MTTPTRGLGRAGPAQHARVLGRGEQVRPGQERAADEVLRDLVGIVDHAVHRCALSEWDHDGCAGTAQGRKPVENHGTAASSSSVSVSTPR